MSNLEAGGNRGGDTLYEFLKNDLVRKQRKNPSFSLRSFARQLNFSAATLSRILNGKREISNKSAARIFARLSKENPTLAVKMRAQFDGRRNKCEEFTPLDILKIDVISEWYYFAILSLAETMDFNSNPAWIAGRLGIPVLQAKRALEKLESLGLLVRKDRQLLSTGKQLTTTDRIVNLSVRRNNYQALELAKKALDGMSDELFKLTDFSGMTIATDPELIAAANVRIKKFRRRLCAFLERGKKKEVYRLGIQLFPMSKRFER